MTSRGSGGHPPGAPLGLPVAVEGGGLRCPCLEEPGAPAGQSGGLPGTRCGLAAAAAEARPAQCRRWGRVQRRPALGALLMAMLSALLVLTQTHLNPSSAFVGCRRSSCAPPVPACRRHASAARDDGTSQTVIDALNEFDGNFKAPFELLEIEDPDVPKAQIRKAFRKIARFEHPDVSDKPDAEDRFRRISMAYELLMDDGGRAMVLEALERKVEDLEELEYSKTELDAGNENWDKNWVEDEYTATSRTIFLITLSGGLGSLIWWWGSDHD